MKIFLKTAFAVVFLASCGFIIAAQKVESAKNSFAFDEKSAKPSARDLYINNCARCHGADGKSETPTGRNLGADDLTLSKVQRMSRKKLTAVIANGKDEMPGFGKKLSKAEIAQIVNYVRSF